MPISHLVETHLAQVWPAAAWRDVTVVAAVSGGADSVALLRALHAIRERGPGRLCVAHFNHHLRGAESDADEAFVVELATRLGLECRVGHAPAEIVFSYAGQGPEALARGHRYDFFRRTADELGARYLVTAHTADDQAETILHRILRGTGIAGLAGIARARTLSAATTLIRPLLGLRRPDLEHYLAQCQQSYRGDSSNADPRFTRNRIRRELLPHLAQAYNANVVHALLRLGTLADEVQNIVDTLVEGLRTRCVVQATPGGVRFNLAPLAGQPRYLVRELLLSTWDRQGWPLQAMGFAQWDQLADLAAAGVGKQTFPGGVQATAVGAELSLTRT